MALVVGGLALLAGILRLGFLANFISEPVLKGFIIGLALTIIVGQVPKLLGVEKTEGDFFEQLWGLLGKLGDTSGLTLLVGLASLILVLGLRKLMPVVPASLVAVIFGIALVQLFDLDAHGVAIIGHIDSGLPSFGLPDVDTHRYLDLVASAAGVMLIGFAEGLGAAKTYAAKNRYEIDANRELIGLGAANIGAGLSSGMIVNGSLSKTAVNGSSGANSQLSALVVAGLTVVTLLFLTGLFEKLPEATLAAIVIAALIELIDIGALTRLYRFHSRAAGPAEAVATRADFVAAIAALLGVLVFDTLPGLVIGIGVSILLLVYRASRPHVATLGKVPGTTNQWGDVERHPENERPQGIVVLRPESALFFANSDAVRREIRARATGDTHAVVLDAETMAMVDTTATAMLSELADDLRDDGIDLVVAHALGPVRDLLRLGHETPTIKTYPTVNAAVAALSNDEQARRASTS
jgi:high affinity sulfate transporter 1